MRVLPFLVKILLLFHAVSSQYTTGTTHKQLNPLKQHVAFVSLPISHHFEPLLAMAIVLAKRGHYVSFAVPYAHEKWVRSFTIPASSKNNIQWVWTDSPKEQLAYSATLPFRPSELLNHSIVLTKDRNYDEVAERSWYEWLPSVFEFSKVSNALSRKDLYNSLHSMLSYYNTFHQPMLPSLVERYKNDKPDLFVVDRYTFAGFSAADFFDVPYIVNSPGPLSDIDDPANHVPAPLSGNSIHRQTVVGRCLNLIFRLRYRLVVAKVYKGINEIRAMWRIKLIHSRQDMYGKSVVLANTVFGIDDARPMSPLIVVVGSMNERSKVGPLQMNCTGGGAYSDGSNEGGNKKNRNNNKNRQPNQKNNKNNKNKPTTNSVVLDLSSRVPVPFSVLETILQALNESTAVDHVICILPHKSEALYRSNSAEGHIVHTAYNIWCDQVELQYQRTGRVPDYIFSAKAVLLSGDSGKIYQTVARSQPMVVLPFYADQLDMAVRLERVGCGIMVNPMANKIMLHQELLRAIQVVVEEGPVRSKMTNSIRWLQGVLHSTGGVEEAVNYIVTIAQYGSDSIIPRKDGLEWYEQLSLDVYAILILCLLVLWFFTKMSSNVLFMLWNNIASADLSTYNP
tara:strand:+ start:158 stop:2026 length:1869 start_codon:yes stop_codon:yes gene_type:complete